VAKAPVAFAGAIMAGLARFIETLSLHAAEFGVGMTVIAGSISVLARSATGDGIAPGGGLGGMSPMASGNAAELISAFPGDDVHEPAAERLPSGGAAEMVPVVLPLGAATINTGCAGGNCSVWLVSEVIVVGVDIVVLDIGMEVTPTGLIGEIGLSRFVPAIVGALPSSGVVVVTTCAIEVAGVAETAVVAEATLSWDGDSATTSGEQLTLVPGSVGFCANGGEASVVAGAPGTVKAEKRLVNGLGPLSGDETIAPGVVGTPNSVVPMVDICARD
jgi:hypothetical protein